MKHTSGSCKLLKISCRLPRNDKQENLNFRFSATSSFLLQIKHLGVEFLSTLLTKNPKVRSVLTKTQLLVV